MRSFLSSSSTAPQQRASHSPARPGRSFWHRQSGAIGMFAAGASADGEAAQRALLYRSEAFAEDLGPGYAGLRFTASAATAARR